MGQSAVRRTGLERGASAVSSQSFPPLRLTKPRLLAENEQSEETHSWPFPGPAASHARQQPFGLGLQVALALWLSLTEVYEREAETCLIPEYVSGDLFDAITESVKFMEHDAAVIITDLCEALVYIHSKTILHRDLKPENLLVSSGKRIV
ncbi:PREDICTED: probable serine/threonine-protein kinase HSL1, partial [Tauraco erythrolophus]|uniref:probable serine/threonine-protein kinase HSL1 n=1 Tax=Tauraco erythrolophus TaxID=121530 RepID=UPI000523BB3D